MELFIGLFTSVYYLFCFSFVISYFEPSEITSIFKLFIIYILLVIFAPIIAPLILGIELGYKLNEREDEDDY